MTKTSGEVRYFKHKPTDTARMKVENGKGVWIYDHPTTGPFASAAEKAVEEALAGLWTECNERGDPLAH